MNKSTSSSSSVITTSSPHSSLEPSPNSHDITHSSDPASSSSSLSQSQPPSSSSSGSSYEAYVSSGSQVSTSSSQATTLSNEETDYQDTADGDEAPNPLKWGTMMPLNKYFLYFDFVDSGCDEQGKTYTFGRVPPQDYLFKKESFKEKETLFLNLSRNQFEIYKEIDPASPCGFSTFLKDLSSNGTFVEGRLVGKDVTTLLPNLSTISVVSPEEKAFLFVNEKLKEIEQQYLPVDFKVKYILEDIILGDGASGTVRRARDRKNNKKVAVKIIKKTQLSVNTDFAYEANLMKDISHPNIVKVENFFESTDAVFLVLELVEGGELFDFVKTNGPIVEEKCKVLFLQLLEALEYLHSKEIVHRDLKPENILLSSKDLNCCVMKITDFGLSRFISEKSLLKSMVGTMAYCAPEVIEYKGYSNAIDLWSMGCVLFIILSGGPPFVVSDDLHQDICKGRYDIENSKWKNITKPAKDLVQSLLTVNVDQRISLSDALQHEWFTGISPLKKRKVEE